MAPGCLGPWVLPAWAAQLAGVRQAHKDLSFQIPDQGVADQAPPVAVWMHSEAFLGCGLGEGGEYWPLRLHPSATAPGAGELGLEAAF